MTFLFIFEDKIAIILLSFQLKEERKDHKEVVQVRKVEIAIFSRFRIEKKFWDKKFSKKNLNS